MTNLEGGLFERAAHRMEELTPETGFAVVGVDGFEALGDELFFVSRHETRKDAEAAAEAMGRAHPMDHFHIYTREVETPKVAPTLRVSAHTRKF